MKEITVPSGHKVFFREKLTWKESKKLRNDMLEKMEINMEQQDKQVKQTFEKIKANVMIEQQEAKMKLLFVKIEQDGATFQGDAGWEKMGDWTEEDGQHVENEFSKLFGEKKEE